MSQVRTRSSLRRGVAVIASAALVAGGAVALASTGATAAGATAVTTASATWGFKASFRNYLAGASNNNSPGKSDGATIEVAEGAAFTSNVTVGTPPRNAADYAWPVATPDGGTYDAATRTGTIHLRGKVTYTLR